MVYRKKVKTAILTPNDLAAGAEGKEHVVINDFTTDVQNSVKNADIVIYENESKIRTIIVFNDSLVEDAPAHVALAQ